MSEDSAVSEGTQPDGGAATATPEQGERARETPKQAGLQAAREAAMERIGSDEPEQPEEAEAPEGEAEPEPEATEESPRDVRDGIPTPPEERITEDVPEGTYREESTGRLKDAESHRYLEEPAGEGVETGEGDVEAEEGDEAPEADAEASEGPPEGFEMVELPQNHPLRDRGETHIPLPSEEMVGEQYHQYFRSQVNNAVRSTELEQERKRRRETERRLAEIEAEREAREEATETLQEQRQEFLADEDNRRIYEDLASAYGEEQAEAWLQGQIGTTEEQLTTEKKQERLSEKEWERRAHDFQRELTETLRGAPLEEAYKGWAEQGQQHFHQRFSQALATYAQKVDAHGLEPDVGDFVGFLDRFYAQTPGGQQHIRNYDTDNDDRTPESEDTPDPESLKEELREEIVEELKGEKESEEEELTDAAERRAAHPAARMPQARTGARTPRDGDEEADLTDMTSEQVKDHYKERLKSGSGR